MQWRRSPSIPLMTHHMSCLSSVMAVMTHDGKFVDNLEESGGKYSWDCVQINKDKMPVIQMSDTELRRWSCLWKTPYSFHYSVVLDTEVSSNYSAVFQNKGQHMSVSCVICLDGSSRTENLVDDSLCGLFPRLPRGQNWGNFLYVSFTFFLLPSSNKDAVTGGGFSEPDMSCVCFDEVMAWIIVCFKDPTVWHRHTLTHCI